MNLFQFIQVIAILINFIEIIICGKLENMIDVKQNHAIKEIRILYQSPHREDIPHVYSIIRGVPLFAEIDFIPRYIPSGTQNISVSVIIPGFTCNGRQYVVGHHQEHWEMAPCRLCTNTEQSYTLPLMLYLRVGTGCFDGRIPTYWRVEAIPYRNRPTDVRQDYTIGLVYDKERQIRICSTTATSECSNARNIFISHRRLGRNSRINELTIH